MHAACELLEPVPMASPKLAWLALIPLISLNGCYRSASFAPKKLAEMRIAEQSAHIVYRNGDTHTIENFDELTVRDRSPDDQTGTHEYGEDVSGELQGAVLRLRDGRGQRTFAIQDVSYLEFEDYTPARPWIIAGAGIAGAALGFAIGVAAVNCPSYSEEPEAGLCGLGALMAGTAGMAIGTGIGLGVSIPLTDPLGTRKAARSAKDDPD